MSLSRAVLCALDSYRKAGRRKSLKSTLKGKLEDSLITENGFFTLRLPDDGSQSQENRAEAILKNYNIEFVQFCHRPISSEILAFGAKLYHGVKFLSKSKDALPSIHHRYIRFLASGPGDNNIGTKSSKVWGTFERLSNEGGICVLYRSESGSLRSEAHVTNVRGFPMEMHISNKVTIHDVFLGVGSTWDGEYHLIKNNCIHYALACWERLGGNASYDDVKEGQSATSPTYNPTC